MTCKNCEGYDTAFGCGLFKCNNILSKRLYAYEDAEKQGLLVRLPCKVGDTVYFIFRDKIYSGLILRVNLCKGFETQSVTIHVKYSIRGHVLFDAGEIGKTVFFTREAAEAALKGEAQDV